MPLEGELRFEVLEDVRDMGWETCQGGLAIATDAFALPGEGD